MKRCERLRPSFVAVNACRSESFFSAPQLERDPLGRMMKPNGILITSSLVTILLVTFHLTDDIVRQMEPGNLSNLVILVLIVTLWLYGTLMLPGRRSGHVIMILGSVLGLVIPVVHMKGAGVGAALVQSDGGFFFVRTLLALGAGAAFTLVLAARGLWGLRRGAPPQ